ncbi:PREDICTED: phosphoserine phosphatase isoform X2 [Papilio polytes]|uniref:phosphoserine phosphatase isoform X2 n=1 Tax=Papilio polytes TaxID=76194 RepID=UPI0006762F58|nr:PREDICTED: phosphoserine phosphatase isoform X2 [Papilio polytes]
MALYSLKSNLQYATLKTLSLVSISVMTPQQTVQELFRTADCVCFDVDSTVIRDEGIDELARFCGKGDEVKRLTAEAMGGSMTFQEALKKRLDIIRPTASQIRQFIATFPINLTPGITQLVKALQDRGVTVYLVSGGFRCLIDPVAEILNIPVSNVYANRLKFFFNGEYAGFDENEPTSRSGGKGLVIRRLKEQHSYQRLVMIGDGATDAEASPPADGFIGFGGNVIRDEVRKKAAWYVTDFQELLTSLTIQAK